MKTTVLASFFLCFFSITMGMPKHKALKIAIISGANEYVTHITLKEYKHYLETQYTNINVVLLQAGGPVNEKDEFSELEGTEVLKECDILLVFARRTTIAGKAIEDIKNFVASGKPVVGLRTASHAFQNWPEFDKTVLGGNYSGHYFGEPEKRKIGADGVRVIEGETTGPVQKISINAENKNHPVLQGISNFESKYSLYKTAPLAAGATLLLTGTTDEGSEPLAWTRDYNGARVVYIALGGVQDWKNPIFTKLVTNALLWAANFKAKTRK